METDLEQTQPELVEVKRSNRLVKVVFGTIFILCFVGTVVGLPLAVTLTKNCDDDEIVHTTRVTTTSSTTLKTLPALGWQDWTAWTECSVTCGIGQSTRSRECITLDPGTEVDYCDRYQNMDELQSKDCQLSQCQKGRLLVQDLTKKARVSGVDDKLFLDRYAAAVTLNGEMLNAFNASSQGFGIWRMTEMQYSTILTKRTLTNESYISDDIISNVNVVCALNLREVSLSEALELAESDPCFSMMGFVTYLYSINKYPLPLDFASQETILNQTTDQILLPWYTVLENELREVQNECMQSDIDFDFVIDSSGSVGPEDWQTTMEAIGTNWIKEALVPSGAKTCGNHVAGRWFSTETQRFHDFEPPEKEVYSPQKYSDYVGDIFINQSYISGGTKTAKALDMVRVEDMPMAREGLKYVALFTDGQSNEPTETEIAAKSLHQVADRTYALGIGTGINMTELGLIASNANFVGDMTSFSQLTAFIRVFVLIQDGCYTSTKLAHRAIDLKHMKHYGMSWQSGKVLRNQVDSECQEKAVCPFEDETGRLPACAKCSKQIATSHKPILMYNIRDAVVEASEYKCFPPEIILAMVSRLSIENNAIIPSPTNDGWRPCKLQKHYYEDCYGLMQIPRSKNPNTFFSGSSMDHFLQAIVILIDLIEQISSTWTSFSTIEQTRAAIAAYDAGISTIRGKNSIDESTKYGDFSADVMARAEYLQDFL